MYYIDTWRLHEILKALPLYPNVTREQAVERYRQFGGTVRDVLANAHVEGHTFEVQVVNAISGEDVDLLCNLQWMGTSSTVVRHRWAHMRVSALRLHDMLPTTTSTTTWHAVCWRHCCVSSQTQTA